MGVTSAAVAAGVLGEGAVEKPGSQDSWHSTGRPQAANVSDLGTRGVCCDLCSSCSQEHECSLAAVGTVHPRQGWWWRRLCACASAHKTSMACTSCGSARFILGGHSMDPSGSAVQMPSPPPPVQCVQGRHIRKLLPLCRPPWLSLCLLLCPGSPGLRIMTAATSC